MVVAWLPYLLMVLWLYVCDLLDQRRSRNNPIIQPINGLNMTNEQIKERLTTKLLEIAPGLKERKLYVNVVREDYFFINFYNLPETLPSCGAEKENNRQMFSFTTVKESKYKLTHTVNALPDTYQLRAKTADLDTLLRYLGAHLTKVIAEVSPNLTHSKV